MDKNELIKKIILKKEFSDLPMKDVELIFSKFDKDKYSDIEKVKLTRDLLRKVFSVFTSKKLLNIRNYSPELILKKHVSTKERFQYYEELYRRLLTGMKGKLNIIDLGAGVNGFSYKYFNKKIYYVSVEGIGQLVNLVKNYFNKEKINAKAVHLSLFEIEKIKDLIKETKGHCSVYLSEGRVPLRQVSLEEGPKTLSSGAKIVFLFKTIDSLEMVKRDYSKELISQIAPLVDKVVVSFATRSLIKKKKFRVNRDWFINFIKNNFKVLDDFELGNERYVVFGDKKNL